MVIVPFYLISCCYILFLVLEEDDELGENPNGSSELEGSLDSPLESDLGTLKFWGLLKVEDEVVGEYF